MRAELLPRWCGPRPCLARVCAEWTLIAAQRAVSRQNREELLAVTGLIEDGKLTPVVDRTYPLAKTAEGLRHLEHGHARGKAVVTVA